MTSLWETRHQNHALWSVLDQVRGQLDSIETPSDVDGADSLSRLLWVGELLQAHRSVEDVRGYTPTMLSNVQAQLAGNIQNNLAQYLTDPEAYRTYLRTAADNVDTVLDQMGTWPLLPSKGAAIAAGQAASAYEKATSQALTTLKSDRDTAIAEVAQLKSEVTSQTKAMAESIASFESNASEALEAKLDSVSSDLLATAKTSIESLSDSQAEGSRVLNDLEAMRGEGRKVLEAIANRAVAKDYRTNARNKSIAGWIWDALGLLIGGVPLVILLVHFFQPGAAQSSVSVALTRIGISVGAVGLAALCFHRGSVNHAESRRSKRADIRLTTVHPFIANQDAEFQQAVIEGMADRIYLQGMLDDGAGDGHDGALIGTLIERIRQRGGAEPMDAV